EQQPDNFFWGGGGGVRAQMIHLQSGISTNFHLDFMILFRIILVKEAMEHKEAGKFRLSMQIPVRWLPFSLFGLVSGLERIVFTMILSIED
ncbi:hypothetical protein ACJX0J_037755, partial [Zea mays]